MSATTAGGIQTELHAWEPSLSDEEIVLRVCSGELALYEILMRRNNQRLYRAVRGILRDEADVEDVLQESYLAAYRNLAAFEGRARFSTWLTRIAVNRALDRRRKRAKMLALDPRQEGNPVEGDDPPTWGAPVEDPERQSARRELARLLEDAIDELPVTFRGVYILREVEGLSTEETAESLGIEPNTVKTRLHRARGLLRQRLVQDFDGAAADAFAFGARRCDRLVETVLTRLHQEMR